MQTSKAFHATLPWLDASDLSRLRAWACENCVASNIVREDGIIVWRAAKERARTREARLRSVRCHAQASCERFACRGAASTYPS